MRRSFFNTLESLAEKDNRIILLAPDVGFGVVEPFAAKFPNRFINPGIGEANAVGIATGLSIKGKIPFVYTINPFLAFHALEQIRMLSHMNLHAILVGVGLGEEYTNNGISHYSNGDEQVLLAMPNLSVITPKLKSDVSQMVISAYENPAPYYLRLSRF